MYNMYKACGILRLMVKNSFYSRIFAAVVAGALSLAIIPITAIAANNNNSAITATRSFPKVTNVKRDLFTEAVYTDVDANSKWGGIETLNVPQTKSAAERRQELIRRHLRDAQNGYNATVSRDASRGGFDANQTFTVTPPNENSVDGLLNFAAQFVGKVPYVWGGTTPAGWDCSGFVGYVYGQMGVSLPRTSGAQAGVGRAVPNLAEAHPGDIIANGQHAAIYVGNGMVVNAQNGGTQYSPIRYVFTAPYSIRRIF